MERAVLRAPVICAEEAHAQGVGILIKAQPQRDDESCLFMFNQQLLDDASWYFDSPESAKDSPVVAQLMNELNLDSVTVDGSTVLVTVEQRSPADWEEWASRAGAILREGLTQNEAMVNSTIIEQIPDEKVIREGIQKCIDEEVNPGVAAHSGYITLTDVRGNSVTIQMGGGCQGCSAADLTLKQGIHEAFRKAVPFVGAIYDDTDHAAGENPYFS
jgi:Fe-S cluster biogenesis protein NfuA